MLCYEWALLAVGQHSDNMQTISGPEMFGGGGTFVIHTSSRLLDGIFEYGRCMWRVADEVCKSPNSYSLGYDYGNKAPIDLTIHPDHK